MSIGHQDRVDRSEEGDAMTQQTSHRTYGGPPAANYERYFVPAIGTPLAGELIELAGLRPGEHVLDVACGTGVVARFAAERVGHSTVTGVDINPGMLAVARNAARDAAIEWHEASAEALPLADGTFDVVLCQMGLQFFPDREGALREIWRVLRPGGRVVLNLPGPTPPMFAVLEGALRRHIGPEAGGFVATVFSLHDTEELRELLEGARLTDVRTHSERKALSVPPAEDFLWQYVYSTPLADAATSLDESQRADLQQEVVAGWESFDGENGLLLEVDVTSAIGRKA
jgi:ubiquinone/menaquinone biosynthesis C-methylase UbiE